MNTINDDSSHQVFSGDTRKDTKTATIVLGGTVSTPVDISMYRSGMFWLTSEFNGDTITILVSNKGNGGFSAMNLNGSTLSGSTFTCPAGGGEWHQIPEGIFSSGAIKIQTGSTVGADATITFCLKA